MNEKEAARRRFHERRGLETNEHDFAFLDGYDAGCAVDNGWVRTDERLPDEAGYYLVYRKFVVENEGTEKGKEFWDVSLEWFSGDKFWEMEVTHWRKIVPPEEQP